MNAQQGIWGRRAVYFLLVSLMVACAMQNDALADYKKWSKKKQQEVESTPGTVIQSTTDSGHTREMRTKFSNLGVNCCVIDAVSERDDYVYAVSNHGDVPKKYLYSLTHGHGLTLQQTPLSSLTDIYSSRWLSSLTLKPPSHWLHCQWNDKSIRRTCRTISSTTSCYWRRATQHTMSAISSRMATLGVSLRTCAPSSTPRYLSVPKEGSKTTRTRRAVYMHPTPRALPQS